MVPWLDAWPRCPVCDEEIDSGEKAPGMVLRAAIKADRALQGRDVGALNAGLFAEAVARLWEYVLRQPEIVRAFAIRASLPQGINQQGVVIAVLFETMFDARYGMGCPGRGDLFSFLFGRRANASAVAAALIEYWSRAAP
ncbi:MAG: hypothetical protein ABSE59_04440, partial [Opitutaceae bacterium]